MVKSIEEYISETTKSYDPAIKAYNNQLSGLSGQTENAIKDIEKQYAAQNMRYMNDANQAAEAASLSAAGNGGSFGGAAEEAYRKYYQKSFIPAITSANANKSSAITQARTNEAERRSNLEQQLANLYTQANTYGTQRYDDAIKQEEAVRQYNENLALQKAQLEAQAARDAEAIRQYNENLALQKAQLEESKRQHDATIAEQRYATDTQARAYSYLDGNSSNEPTVKAWDFGNGYQILNDNGKAVYTKNGTKISALGFLANTGKTGANYDLWKDIWNNQVKTEGVGLDTVSAFSGNNLGKSILAAGKNGRYEYLGHIK